MGFIIYEKLRKLLGDRDYARAQTVCSCFVFLYLLFSVYRAFWTLLWLHLFTEMLNMIIYIFASSGISVFTCAFYRVTDEALIAETAVWPIFFLFYERFLCS